MSQKFVSVYPVIIYIYKVIFIQEIKLKFCCVVIKRWMALVPTSSIMYRLLQMYSSQKAALIWIA